MASFQWIARRYKLPNYTRSELDSTIRTWVKQRGANIRRDPKIGIAVGFYYGYVITPPGQSNWGQRFIALMVRYRSPYLFVYRTNHLPDIVSTIVDDCITPFVTDHGGTPFDERPLVFDGFLAPLKQVEDTTP